MTDTIPNPPPVVAFLDALARAQAHAAALPPSREAALAKTKLEEAIMWGERIVTFAPATQA